MASVAVNPPKTPVTKGSNGIAAATIPNVCKMPGPPAPFVPTPLPNIGRSALSPKGYSKKVKIEGNPVAIKGASFASQGDIASKGTGGGIVSSNTHGPTKFVGPGSLNVKIEGKNVHYLSDPMLNNCGPSGSPPNSATLAGVLQAPGAPTPALVKDLEQIAKECNEEVNKDAGFVPPEKPEGKKCTQLGTKKHSCCEKKIKEANHPRVKSEQAFKKDGTPSPKTRGQALGAGRKAAQKVKAAGGDKAAQKAAFGKAFYPNLPPITLDVVILKDPAKAATKDNIEKVIDFKFNCKEKPHMAKKQRRKYTKAMDQEPQLIHYW